MRLLLGLVSFLFLNPIFAIEDFKNEHIINPDSYPANLVVQLELQAESANGKVLTGSCSGTIVSENLILTAKHCLFPENIKILKVIESKKGTASSYQFAVHPNASDSDDDVDIAFIYFPNLNFSGPFPIIDFVITFNEKEADIFGYGIKRSSEKSPDGLLRSKKCKVKAAPSEVTHLKILCGIMQGDSGGPVFLENKVIGVASKAPNGYLSWGGRERWARILFSEKEIVCQLTQNLNEAGYNIDNIVGLTELSEIYDCH